VHIIRSGAIELFCDLGGRRGAVEILRPGDVAGDVPLFLQMSEPFDAVALEDSLILSIDSLTLHRLLEERPRLAWQWLLSVSARMASAQARLVELLAGDAATTMLPGGQRRSSLPRDPLQHRVPRPDRQTHRPGNSPVSVGVSMTRGRCFARPGP
jgi:CRP-like cAMP-binding protein